MGILSQLKNWGKITILKNWLPFKLCIAWQDQESRCTWLATLGNEQCHMRFDLLLWGFTHITYHLPPCIVSAIFSEPLCNHTWAAVNGVLCSYTQHVRCGGILACTSPKEKKLFIKKKKVIYLGFGLYSLKWSTNTYSAYIRFQVLSQVLWLHWWAKFYTQEN